MFKSKAVLQQFSSKLVLDSTDCVRHRGVSLDSDNKDPSVGAIVEGLVVDIAVYDVVVGHAQRKARIEILLARGAG